MGKAPQGTTVEDTLYNINGTLMRLATAVEKQSEILEKMNWNLGAIQAHFRGDKKLLKKLEEDKE